MLAKLEAHAYGNAILWHIMTLNWCQFLYFKLYKTKTSLPVSTNLQIVRRQCCYRKGGVAGPDTPKMQALPEWGGSDPCLDFFEGFVHMH